MYRGLAVAAVVPAYREQEHIADVIRSMPELVDHIVVVDDASPDATGARARDAADARTVVLTLTENEGVGGAVLTGHRAALDRGADVCVVMAGDGQMDPDFLPSLLDPIADGRAEFTKANRFYGRGSFRGMPRTRILGNIALSFLTKAASGYWNLFDPQNGYTAIHRDALVRLPFDQIARRYDFENDLLINLNILRVPAVDVPVPARYGREVSGMRLATVGPRIALRLVRGFWTRIWWKYVLQSFSAVALLLFSGLALTLVGAVVGLWILFQTLGPPIASAGTVLLCVGPLLSGIHMLLFAMLLDIQESAPPPRVTRPRRP
jgi:glycosyltransferase involved in cell wall biosynthesis